LIPEFILPGTLERTCDDCNTVVSAEVCKDCGKAEARFYHCNNWNCSECSFWTSSRAAQRVEERLTGVQRAFSMIGKYPGRILHVTFSVPEIECDDFDHGDARKKCIKFAKMVGILGGGIVFHPYRFKDEYRKLVYDALKSSGLPGGIYRYAIDHNPLGLDSWRSYFNFSPHFHILGFYPRIVMKSNKFHELTGWVYKAVDINHERNVFKTARYILTHHAVPDGHKQSVVYFGIASNSKTSVESLKTVTFKRCPSCGSENYYLISCGAHRFSRFVEGLRPEASEFFVHVRVVKTFKKYTVRLKQADLPAYGVTVNA
jgi:hypothetical protein